MNDYGFKHNIGDLIAFRTRPYQPLFVVERQLNECAGGVQRMYNVRHFTPDQVSGFFMVNEIEVFTFSPEKTQEQEAAKTLKDWAVLRKDFETAAAMRELEVMLQNIVDRTLDSHNEVNTVEKAITEETK